jgi:hypothetical protein
MSKIIAIVTPVLDDWVSFARVVSEISERFTGSDFAFHVYAVDDGSAEPFDPVDIVLARGSCIKSIEMVRLAANLGHQRAIAVGLCAIADDSELDAVVVMDSDGQDRHGVSTRAISCWRAEPDAANPGPFVFATERTSCFSGP